MQSIYLALIAGLTTGGISCFAIQSGLLASSLGEGKDFKSNTTKVILFLAAKLAVYTLLGFILGYIGSFFLISSKIQAVIQFVIGIFLIGTAGRMLNLHPIFRYFAITPPKAFYKVARSGSKLESSFAPLVAGALTVLLPCGVTQAMMLSAVSSGSSFIGALILFAFVLGTTPAFFLLGVFASEVMKRKSINYIAAGVVFIFGIMSLNATLALMGSQHTLQNYWRVIKGSENTVAASDSVSINNGIQEATIFVTSGGYKVDNRVLKVGVPARVKLVTNNTYSCARAFTIPSMNITRILDETGVEYIEFTPTKVGTLSFSCTMGMYTGSFTVVK